MSISRMEKETIVLGIVVVLLAIAGIWDKQITQMLMNQGSYFATFFQNYGLVFAGIIIFMATQIFIYYAQKSQLPTMAKISIYFLSFISGLYEVWQTVKYALFYTASSLSNLDNNLPIGAANNDGGIAAELPSWYSPALFILTIVLFILGSYLCSIWLKNKEFIELKALVIIGLGGIVAVYASSTIVDVMKNLWGRFRPYELVDDWSQFTSWFKINGANGHKSFPSGHSEYGWLALYMPLFINQNQTGLRKKVFIFSCVFGTLMALSRVIVGAHFLSDVTVGSFIPILVIYTISRLLNQRFDGTSL